MSDRRWEGLRGRYNSSSLRTEIYLFNFTHTTITYYDRTCGLLTAKPLGNGPDGFTGLVIQVSVDVPFGEKPTPHNSWDNQVLDFIIENGQFESKPSYTRYRYAAEIASSDIAPNKILEDRRLGIMFCMGEADWALLDNQTKEGISKNFRGHTQSVELVDDYRENIFLCGFSRVKPIRAVTTAVSGKQAGVYVSTINDLGLHEVFYYTSCESCRSELDIPLFDKFHEAEAFIDRGTMPSGKRSTASSSSSGPSLSERLRSRMDNPGRPAAEPRPSAKTSSGDFNKQNSSKSNGRNEDEGYFSVIKEVLSQVANKYPVLVTVTLASVFVIWKVGPHFFEWLSKRESASA